MNMNYELKKHEVSISESSVDVKMKAFSIKDNIGGMIFSAILSLSCLFIIFLLWGSFVSIIFGILTPPFICVIVYSYIMEFKRTAIFSFQINSGGVTHRDVGKCYRLGWHEIENIGFVGGNPIIRKAVEPDQMYQICVYFSKTFVEYEKTKKIFWYLGDKRYSHGSNDEIIILGLMQNSVDPEFKSELLRVISLYCNPDKISDYLSVHN